MFLFEYRLCCRKGWGGERRNSLPPSPPSSQRQKVTNVVDTNVAKTTLQWSPRSFRAETLRVSPFNNEDLSVDIAEHIDLQYLYFHFDGQFLEATDPFKGLQEDIL